MKKIALALTIGLIMSNYSGAAIQDIQVSNNTRAAATISWITDNMTTGEVHYSENSLLSNPTTAYDVRGQAFEGCTHYVEIENLDKETTYYFEVLSGSELDNDSGDYYTFKTMKEPFAPPGICLHYGYVYKGGGSTAAATGAILYLWVTHNGEESYPLSKLIDSRREDEAAFVFNVRETRSVDTDELFPSINIGDPIHLKVVYCGDLIVQKDMVFKGCTYNCGSMTLVPSSVTPTTVPTITPTTTPTTTTTTDPTTTTILSTTTTAETPPPQCEVIIVLPSEHVSTWEKMQLSARTFCDGEAVTGNYVWYVDTSSGSKIDENGLYKAGAVAGTDTVTAIDTLLNDNNVATGMITISPLWPMAYDKMWGDKKGTNLSILRQFRDDVLADSEMGRDYVFMLYNNSLEILLLLLQDPSLIQETTGVIDELLPGITTRMNGNEMILSKKQLADMGLLLSRFESKASPELKAAIRKVGKDMRERRAFEQLRIQMIMQ